MSPPDQPKKRTRGKAKPAEPTTGIGTLYIDCQPDFEVDDATEIFGAARDKVVELAAAQGAPIGDYRQVEYGKGTGLFGAAVDAYIKDFGAGRSFVVDSGNTDFQNTATILARAASAVVRGR